LKLLGISGTLVGSKTRVSVEQVLEFAVQENPDVKTELLDLKDYNLEFCNGKSVINYNEDTQEVIEKVCSADAFIIGTSIFQGSFTGALKNLFDLIPPKALRHKVMGFVANGGTFQHYLVVENQLKPIAGFLRSYVAPGHVYLNNSHFNSKKEIIDQDALERLYELAQEVSFMQIQLERKSEFQSFLVGWI